MRLRGLVWSPGQAGWMRVLAALATPARPACPSVRQCGWQNSGARADTPRRPALLGRFRKESWLTILPDEGCYDRSLSAVASPPVSLMASSERAAMRLVISASLVLWSRNA